MRLFLMLTVIFIFQNSYSQVQQDFAEVLNQFNPRKEKLTDQRTIEKKQRFHISGPSLTHSIDSNYYDTYGLGIGGRYFFTEALGWEFLNIQSNNSNEQKSFTDLQKDLGAKLNSSAAKVLSTFSSSAIYSPVYGKYLLGSEIYYFDAYLIGGLGVLTTESSQIRFLEGGLGINNYFRESSMLLMFDFRYRSFLDHRADWQSVGQSQIQLGVGYIL